MNSRFVLVLTAPFLLCTAVFAQQTSPATTPRQSSQPERKIEEHKIDEHRIEEQRVQKQGQSQRMGGLLPQFGVVNGKDAPPLTPRGKFRLFYKSALDPAAFAVSGLVAGIGQAEDSFPAYGQGATGYGKRYGAAFTDQASSAFFANFFYPVLFKADPRYFRMGEGSFKRRFGHALAQEFIAHEDAGGQTFNWSNSLGALTAGSISNAYYPSADRGFGLTVGRAGIALLYGSLGALGSEFWPDISRKLHHQKKPAGLAAEQTQK
jgi:hypothetical protein